MPVGYYERGQPRVVMDISLFDRMTAEESIAHANKACKKTALGPEVHEEWDR
jgi:hypothetical protein